jgi:mannose-6-phosphate isomerase
VDLLDVPRLVMVRAHLGAADDVAGALRMLADWPLADRRALVAEIDDGAADALRTQRAAGDPAVHAALAWVQRLVEQRPADPLVLAPLLLSLHRLGPGGALFVPCGVPHAYLRGTAVEVTSVLSDPGFGGHPAGRVEPVVAVGAVAAPSGERVFLPPVAEFLLTQLALGGEGSPAVVQLTPLGDGPQVLLCLAGTVVVEAGGHQVVLEGGDSAFLGAGCATVLLRGQGELFRAMPGVSDAPEGG